MTSLADSSGTAVDPTWSVRTTAPPVARTMRVANRSNCWGQLGSGSTRTGGPSEWLVPVRTAASKGTSRSLQSRSTSSRTPSGDPELSSHTSAAARRAAESACAAIRARAACSVIPRSLTNREIRTFSGASTTTTSGNSAPMTPSTSNGTSWTSTASGGAAAINSAVRWPINGCRMPLSRRRAASSTNTMSASAGRSSAPSTSSTRSPNCSTTRAKPMLPGRTTSRAT